MNDPVRARPRLYLITPPRIRNITAFTGLLRAALEGGDVVGLQVRIKQGEMIDLAATRAVAQAVLPICRASNVALLINDSPQLARALDADGVHLGTGDMDIGEARDLLGPDKVIGATCHNSRHTAMLAGEAGADYLAFGAFYPGSTKTGTGTAAPETLTWCQTFLTLPCVAIGGIKPDNAVPLLEAGADFLAVCAGVWDNCDGPASAVAAFNHAIDNFSTNTSRPT